MKIKIDILVCTFLIALFSSCTKDYLIQESGVSHLESDEYEFNLLVEDASVRTRAVDFNETGALRINQVWMGVFDVGTGACVSKSKKILDYKTIQSGTTHNNLLKIYLEKPNYEGNFVMVAIANYLAVMDENGEDLDSRLMAEDLTWTKFNQIAVDATTAYSSPHNGLVPVLAGFVYNNEYTSDSHIKINQFDNDKTGVKLSPHQLQDKLTVNGNSSDGYNISNHTLKLRRLVANINVNIQLTEEALNEKELELTDVSYKRYNMPKGVYIIERRTTDCEISNDGSYTPGNFPTEANLSPNWADLNPADSYYNDSDWQYGNTTGFSFQHFANKHWARVKPRTQSEREACTLKDTDPLTGENRYYYTALVGVNRDETDFNNYASYFVVKMHLTDKKNGRALEAEYTIHEGCTSDELGNALKPYQTDNDGNILYDEITKRPIPNEEVFQDFVVARNIDYTYNIFINGVEDIYYNVTKDDKHFSGQGGKVWEFFYVNQEVDMDKQPRKGFELGDDGSKSDNNPLDLTQNCEYKDGGFRKEVTVPPTGGYYTNAIKLTNKNPDLAFRFYGFTCAKKSGSDTTGESVSSEGEEDDYILEEGQIEGYNYNFPQESFTWLHNLWPPSAGNYSHYFQDYNELVNNPNAIPDDLKNGITIINTTASGIGDEKREMNLVEFIKYAHNQDFEGDKAKYFDLKVSPCDLARKPSILKDNYIRTIYIADRKGQKDEDGCTTMVAIFAGVQYPDLDEEIQEAVQLPLPLYRTVNINNYNIIDQYLQTFSIPILPGIPTADYTYKLTIDDNTYSEFGKLENGNYVYKIPMFNFSGTTGTIKLQVIPTEGRENAYEPSEEIAIGNVNLRNHAAWYNTEPEWEALLKNYASENAEESKIEGGYLRIFSTDAGKKMSRQSENSVYYLKTAGGACTIEFKVYKDCKLTVVARTQNNGSAKIRRVDVKVNGIVTQHELQLKSGANSGSGPWTTVTQDIKVNDINGALINLNPAEGGIDIQSVQISLN